jgi:hypothetical protein
LTGSSTTIDGIGVAGVPPSRFARRNPDRPRAKRRGAMLNAFSGREAILQTPRRHMEGGREAVQVKRLIKKRIRRSAPGIDFAADVNADVSVNVAESRSTRADRARPPAGRGADRAERGKENP